MRRNHPQSATAAWWTLLLLIGGLSSPVTVRAGYGPLPGQQPTGPTVSATQTTAVKYKCVPGYNYAGTDIGQISDADRTKCSTECNNKADCSFYILANSGDCWLKSDFADGPNGYNEPDDTIAEACLKMPGKLPAFTGCASKRDFIGTNLIGPFPATEPGFCAAACQARPDCQFYVFRTDKSCALRKDLGSGSDGRNGDDATVTRSCQKRNFKPPVCQPGQGMKSGICKQCPPLTYSLGGSAALCTTCPINQRPKQDKPRVALTCSAAPAPTCRPGQGIQNSLCRKCEAGRASPGGVGVVCVTCPRGQIPNAGQTSCIPGAPPDHDPGYICIANQDYAGTDIDMLEGQTLQQCKAACTDREECTFCVHEYNKNCWLKKQLLAGENGVTGFAGNVQAACLKDAAVNALCPAGWTFSDGLCCDKTVDAQGNCNGFQCAVDSSVYPSVKLFGGGYTPCNQVRAACPSRAAPYAFHAGGYCCSDASQLVLSNEGYPTACEGNTTVVASNGNAAGLARYTPEPNCPPGWQLYGAAAGGFCCQVAVAGSGPSATCPGNSCAVDGNLRPQGQRYCSSVSILRLAVYNLEWCGSGLGQPESRNITDLMYDGQYSLQKFFTEGSFGAAVFTPDSTVIANVDLPCDQFSLVQCDMGKAVEYLQANSAKYGVQNYEDYPYTVYLPPVTDTCREQFAKDGVAGYASGKHVVIASGGANDISTWKHEIGHTIGLPHSGWTNPKTWRFGAYDDLSTPQGIAGAACLYSGPELVKLGWASPPLDRIVQWPAVQAGTKLTFQLTVLADNASTAIVQVVLQSAEAAVTGAADPAAAVSGLGSALYLTYRAPKKQDGGLPEQYTYATSVHTPNGGDFGILAWLKSGRGFINHAYKLVVVQLSGTEFGAEVVLCRYVNRPSDCGQFVDFAALPAEETAVAVAAARAEKYGKDSVAVAALTAREPL